MKKIPYVLASVLVGLGYVSRLIYPSLLAWISVALLGVTAIWYTVSVSMTGDTKKFHCYIGWGWIVLPIIFTLALPINTQTEWNKIVIFIVGLCIGVLLGALWIKDKETTRERADFVLGIGCILIAGATAYGVMGINESVITRYVFETADVVEMETFEPSQTFFDTTNYYIDLNYEDDTFLIESLLVSETYYNSLEVGDDVPICICTGLLGKKFYFLYEEPDKKWDYYGLNEWAREKAQGEQVQLE